MNELPSWQQLQNYYYEQPQLYNYYYYYHYSYYQQAIQIQQQPIIAVKKLSQKQKRKMKYQQNKQQLEKEKQQIGSWVKLQCKPLINEIQRYQQNEKKRLEKRKLKLNHLIEIQKEIYNLRKKLGQLKADTKHKRLMNAIESQVKGHKKKPSRLKQLNRLYHQKYLKPQLRIQANKSYITEEQTEENKQLQKMKKKQEKIFVKPSTEKTATFIQYPRESKLAGTIWNNITLRQWIDHVPSETLQDQLLVLINKLAFNQAMKKIKQPLKAKKRIVSGFHQVMRTLTTINDEKRSKCIIVALNITRNPFKEGSDDKVFEILKLATKYDIPIMHCSTRAKLGRAFTGKFGPRVSVVSVINYQGCEELVNEIIQTWSQLKRKYNEL